MRVATWNVNSIKVRVDHVLAWLAANPVDLLALQEIKVTDAAFPRERFAADGWHALVFGQATYNGVAWLSREPLEASQRGLPEFPDEQARFLGVRWQGVNWLNVYVPNGQAVGSEKYVYKLGWLKALEAYIGKLRAAGEVVAVLGDFNIAPDDRDVYDPEAWAGQIHCSPDERAALTNIIRAGVGDAFRWIETGGGHYSWWDYRQARFRRGQGLRIDLALVDEALRPRCDKVCIDPVPRGWERPSDHAPVVLSLHPA